MYRLFVLILLSYAPALTATEYQKPQDFLLQNLDKPLPATKMLWISGNIRDTTEKILQHSPYAARTRYWQQGQRSAWILEEIGKEKPITVGIIVKDNKIEKLKVLSFRESRGWEIKHSYFTDQFKQAELKADFNLNKPIDGITGATLSVRAVHKLGRLALYYHQQTRAIHDSP